MFEEEGGVLSDDQLCVLMHKALAYVENSINSAELLHSHEEHCKCSTCPHVSREKIEAMLGWFLLRSSLSMLTFKLRLMRV